MFPDSVKLTDHTEETALNQISSAHPTSKSNSLLSALQDILTTTEFTLNTKQVFLFTDGHTSLPDKVLQFIEEYHATSQGKFRLFVFGCVRFVTELTLFRAGSRIDKHFLNQMAKAGRGKVS